MINEQEQLTYILHKVNHEFNSWMNKIFDEFNISQVAVSIIRFVKYNPGVTISEISRKLEIAKSHVSNMIVSFDKENMMEKKPDPSDQRILKIYLTEAGEEFLEEIKLAMRNRVQEVVEELPENQMNLLIGGLQELGLALKKVKEKEEQVEGK